MFFFRENCPLFQGASGESASKVRPLFEGAMHLKSFLGQAHFNDKEPLRGTALKQGAPQQEAKQAAHMVVHLKALGIDLNRWETLTSECSAWRQAVHHGLSQFEETLVQQAEAKRQSQKQQNQGAGKGTDCMSSVWKGLSLSNRPSQPH